MITTTSVITISRTSQDVFDYICTPANVPIWHTGISRFVAEEGMAAGSRGELTMIIMGRQLNSAFVMIENDGHHITKSRSSQGPIKYETTQLVETLSGQKSRLSVHTRIDAGMVFKLAEPALESIASYYMELDLKMLKTILEDKAAMPQLKG